MTTFAQDTFTEATDAPLVGHTPDIGGAWAEGSGNTTNVIVSASGSRAYLASNNYAVPYIASPAPGGVTVVSNATFDKVSEPSSGDYGVALVFAVDHFYIFVWNVASGKGKLHRRTSAGGWAQLGGDHTFTPATTPTLGLRYERDGSGATITLTPQIEGVDQAAVTDTSGERQTGVARPGLFLGDYNGGTASRGWQPRTFVGQDFVVDVAPSILTGPTVTPGRTTANVAATTDELATARVYYGTVSHAGVTITDGNVAANYGSSSAADSTADTSSHSIGLTGLTPSQTYYGRLRVADVTGPNVAYSAEFTWTQLPPDTVAPVVSNVYESAVGPTIATLVGTTDEPATSQYRLATVEANLGAATSTTMEGSAVTAHDIALTGLTANQTYWWQMRATDVDGNTSAWTAARSFTTPPASTLTNITIGAINLVGQLNALQLEALWSGTGTGAIDTAVLVQVNDASALAGDTTIGVQALKAPLQAGMPVLFTTDAGIVEATVAANAATGATSLSVAALPAALTNGCVGISSGVRFRVAGISTWRQALPATLFNNGTNKGFFIPIVKLQENTDYQVEIAYRDTSGGIERRIVTARTRAESEIAALYDASGVYNGPAPSRYVTATGSNANPGTSEGAGWATLEKALASAPAGAIVQFGPGTDFDPADGSLLATSRTAPITLVAKYAAADASGNAINAGNRSIIRPKLSSVPTGQSGTHVAPWSPQTLAGVKTPGVSHTIHKWANAPLPAWDTSSTGWLYYAPSKTAQPRLIPFWIWKDITSTGYDLGSGAGFAEVLDLNDMNQRSGFQVIGNGSGGWDIWAKLPNNENPNNFYVWFHRRDLGTLDPAKGGWTLEGPNQRVCGFEFLGNVAPTFAYDASYGVFDRNLLFNAMSGTYSNDTAAYPAHCVFERNNVNFAGLWSENASYPGVSWHWVKNLVNMSIQGLDTGRQQIGQANEYHGFGGGQGRFTVYRHNKSGRPTDDDGKSSSGFNGFGTYNTGLDYRASYGAHIHDNEWYRCIDDCLEPEQVCLNWAAHDNLFRRNAVALSLAPVHGGPILFARNLVDDWSAVGVTATTSQQLGAPSSRGVAPCVLKYSGNHTSGQQARLYVIHDTFYVGGSLEQRVSQTAGGSAVPPDVWMANCAQRSKGRLWTFSTNPRHWFEDYNILQESPVSDAETEGHQMAGGTWKTVANLATYRANLGTAYTTFHGGKAARTNRLSGADLAFNSTALIDAQLPGASSGNFALQAASAFRNAGMAIPNFSDLAGVNYEGAAPDLGYLEYGLGTLDTTPPAAPTGLTATGGAGQVALDWANNTESDLAGYNVYGANSSGGPFTKLNTGGLVSASAYTETGLGSAVTRHYRVTAVDTSNNESATAATASATTAADTTPPVISGVAVTTITDTSAIVTWATDKPATSQVEYGPTTAYGGASALDTALTTSHSVPVNGLTQLTLYHFRPKSQDAVPNLAVGSDGTFTTIATPDTTGPAIDALTATGITDTGATITWTTDEQANERAEYRVAGSGTWLQSALGPSVWPTHSRTLSGLTPDTDHEYRAISADPSGNSTTSATQTFRTLPSGPVVTGAFSVTAAALTLAWATASPTTSWAEYGLNGAFTQATAEEPTARTSHSATLANLQAGKRYNVRFHNRPQGGGAVAVSPPYVVETTGATGQGGGRKRGAVALGVRG